MSEFCATCCAEEWLEHYKHFKKRRNEVFKPGLYEYEFLKKYSSYMDNPEEEHKLIRSEFGLDCIPIKTSTSWRVMICEGCSRSGSLICPVDDNGFCIDPNCDKHGELNRHKGWYEIGGDNKTLGEYRNKEWDKT